MSKIVENMAAIAKKKIDIGSHNKKIIDALDDLIKFKASKGILIMGNTGSGKTLITQAYLEAVAPYVFIRAIEIPKAFESHGLQFTDELSKRFFPKRHFLIDDLGTEPICSRYGVKAESAELLISELHYKWERGIFSASFTTNLTMAEITERFGERCRWRLQEMCHVFVLGGDLKYKNYRNNGI